MVGCGPALAGCRRFLPSPMVQNHAAFLAFLPGGDLACAWFGGTMEGRGDISIWMSRLDPRSQIWSPAQRLTDAPDRSEQNPVLFVAPDGVVWLFYTSQPGGRQDECQIMARQSQDGGVRFGPARRIRNFTGVFVCANRCRSHPAGAGFCRGFTASHRKGNAGPGGWMSRWRCIRTIRAKAGPPNRCPTALARCI